MRLGVCAAVLATTAAVVAAGPGEAGATTIARPAYVAAADYFGTGDPLNAWSSNMAGAPQAFAQMKGEGFNAVGLVLPWGEFQPGLTPPRVSPTALAELNRLISDAAALHMGVILRLSYEWDADPSDQLPWVKRFAALWSTAHVYAAWLDYISAVHQDVARFGNVWAAYLSWEDLWQPVEDSVATSTPAQQLSLAQTSGYRRWLKSTMSLKRVDGEYGTHFATWSDVPTPTHLRPAFRLMFEYQDWALVHRIFLPAEQRFPGLSLESRVDVDPIHTGTQVVGSYAHTAQFRLPGTSTTGVYFSPYMGDPTSTPNETATDATEAMQHTLSVVRHETGGRPLFIYEYEFGRNSSAVANNPEVIPSQLPAFIAASEPLLKKYTDGYALWTYRDYTLSPLFNPSFALGSQGWTLSGGAHVVDRTTAASRLTLPAGAAAVQVMTAPPGAVASTVTLQAQAAASTSISVQLGTGPAQTIALQPGSHSYHITVPPSSGAALTLTAQGPASVTDVQIYTTPQYGNVYSLSGTAEVGAVPVRQLNARLTSGR